MRLSNNEGCGVAKEIVKVIMTNEDKKVKRRCSLIFIYYLKQFLTLSRIIKLFY